MSPAARSIAQRLAGLEGVRDALLRLLGAEEAEELFALEVEKILLGDVTRGAVTAAQHVGDCSAHADIMRRRLTGFLRGPEGVLEIAEPLTTQRADGALEGWEIAAREIEHAVKGKPARIVAKMNGLVEPEMIQRLYAASKAGVKVDLLVRGMCSLRPGVKGLSENIRVHSVIGRFLEHHRVFHFENAGEAEVFLSSADWMERNLFKRVEVAFPLLDKKLRTQVIEQLQAYVGDTAQSWTLKDDGSYSRIAGGGKPVQSKLLEQLTGADEIADKLKTKTVLLPRVAKPKGKKK